ncbi:PREDICTED: PRUPE_7G026800 [Prunus dulcis]|uniref:PREDICTED: PRUPE_7G026800 n=1 Tax=Prunus dulcis TaxID=3755 RepID=A0A5E4G4H6_PRUDU|nr:PREDICTED: PRUPE_7G026800 [Prunus dulcis]
MAGRKGYLGVAKNLYEKNVVEKGEEIDRALLWKYAREDKNGYIVDEEVALMAEKIDNLIKEKKEGTLTISGNNDVLSMALGTPEHAGRVWGVGGNVKPNTYFKVPKKKSECVSKIMLEQRDSLIMETRKMMEEQQKRHEAAQQVLQNQIEMLKVVINTQVPNNTSLQSPNVHPSPMLSEKALTNIQRKFEDDEKQICDEEGCEDVVEQTEIGVMKGKECKMAFAQRVAVNCALMRDSPLPIPVKGVLETVGDAIGSQVAWPQDLIVFDDKVLVTMGNGWQLFVSLGKRPTKGSSDWIYGPSVYCT